MAHDPWSSLRIREYRNFLLAIGAVSVATQIQTTVMSWQVWEVTRNPFWLGVVGLSEAIPFLSLTLWGGWEADRRDRRTLSLWGLAAVVLSGAMLLASSVLRPVAPAVAPLAGWAALRAGLPFYLAQALAGVGRAFFRPATQALGSELVPREQYHNASTWRSSVFQGAMVVGPALGGAVIALAAPPLAYEISYALVVGLCVVGVFLLSTVAPRPRQGVPGQRILPGLAEGLRFVFGHRLLIGAMSLDLFAVLFGGAVALLPIFARDRFMVGGMGFAVLRAAPAVGSVLMGVAVARMGELERSGPVLLWCVGFFGLTWIGVALSPWFWLAVLLLAAGGALDCISMVVRGTLVQTLTPQEKMGRVAAVNSLFIGSSNEVGEFESGTAARLLGLVPSVVFGGTMTLLTVAGVAWCIPPLRRLGRIRAEEPPADQAAAPVA